MSRASNTKILGENAYKIDRHQKSNTSNVMNATSTGFHKNTYTEKKILNIANSTMANFNKNNQT